MCSELGANVEAVGRLRLCPWITRRWTELPCCLQGCLLFHRELAGWQQAWTCFGMGRFARKRGSEAGAAPLARGHKEARGAPPVGLSPFPLPSLGFVSTWPRAGLGRRQMGSKLRVRVCAAPPASLFCLAGLLALPARFGEGGGDFNT